MRNRAPEVITADFETDKILPRPQYPPKPASLALHWPDGSYDLMAWGHPAGNNCTEREARNRYDKARRSKWPMLFQNGMFDLDVAETYWNMPLPAEDQWHDTMFLIFLNDPHAPSLSLKPSAERLLGIKPEEQDRMNEWIIDNIEAARQKPSEAGAYISRCPYQIVKPYHKGDLIRTRKIFDLLYPLIVEVGMLPAYQRELKLMPILLEAARTGMRIDVGGLARDLPAMEQAIETADRWLCERLKRPNMNIDSDQQLAEALYDAAAVTDWKRTPTKGKLSVSKKNLKLTDFKDQRIHHVLQYRSQMSTSVSMFVRPWLELAGAEDRIYPNWAQVRSPKGDRGDTKGARSGRIICSKPNFLNIPKKWKRAISAGYVHPEFLKVMNLPYIRTYALPDKGQSWGRRDFNQQELRLYGHFEEGPVMRGFLSDPKFDLHEIVRAEEERQLRAAKLRDEFDRDLAKITVFGRVYGQGITGLMQALNLGDGERAVATTIQRAINAAVPSLQEMDDQLRELADEDFAIKTWGGRLYYCEPESYSKKYKRVMTYEYKLLNYLIQGSGADVTKETIIRWYANPKREARMVVTVYDEVDFSSAKSSMKQEHRYLRDAMTSIETLVPMLSDGEVGPSWGKLEALAI